jgi:SAM-dependent methyltransferase
MGCSLLFRHPRLHKDVLDDLYEQGSTEAWTAAETERADWDLLKQALHELIPAGKVLDVGCADGTLLTDLGPRYALFGIELNGGAAEQAQRKGVTLLGNDFHNLRRCEQRFDAVIATDVVEHSHDPLQFLRDCAHLLCPGGIVFITTGDTDARSWRLMRGRYWYCANAEHLSFLNEKWIRRAAQLLSLEVLRIQRFAHDRSPGLSVAQAILNLAYWISPSMVAAARRRLARDPRTRARPDLLRLPPSWSTARDHFLVALRAPLTSA